MSAPEVLGQARAAGIRLTVAGNDLALQAVGPPSVDLFELLVRHKQGILGLLRPGADGWTGENWWTFFKRASESARSKGGLSSEQAEEQAFSWCVVQWMERNPNRSPSDRCAHCGQSYGFLEPYLTGDAMRNPGYTWLHQKCSSAWHYAWRAQAESALAAMGMRVPVRFRGGLG
jgi:hypothetical protein